MEGQIRVCQNHLKSLYSCGTAYYGQIKQRSTTRMMGRQEKEEGKELLMIQSTPPHQWSMVEVLLCHGHVWLPVELVLLYLLMMWLLTRAAGWKLKCLGLHYLLRFNQMLQNSLDDASQCRWTLTWSILQKQPKTFLRQRSGMFCNGQVISSDLNPTEHAFLLLKPKLRAKHPKHKQEVQTAAVKGWQSITREETQHLMMPMCPTLQAVIDCKGFATKY